MYVVCSSPPRLQCAVPSASPTQIRSRSSASLPHSHQLRAYLLMLIPITRLTRSATVPNNRTLRTPLDIIPLPTRLALDLSQPVHIILIDFLHRLLHDLLCCHPAPRYSTMRIDKNEDQGIVLVEIDMGAKRAVIARPRQLIQDAPPLASHSAWYCDIIGTTVWR
jgi:hypothetical protein